ncbi:MAG TPA: hypothetical protein GX526_04940 [Thermoanaerobacterales bacterium]|nr:hypothetical protein [Thermoanaerobacterales bacterium]
MSEEFFSNRELFDLIQETTKEMADLKSEIIKTQTMIRDYNGLRKKVDKIIEKTDRVDKKTEKVDIKVKTLMWVVGISIPCLGLLFTFLNYLKG